MKNISVETVLARAAEIETTLPGRTDVTANIIRAYRELTGASLNEALEWFKTNS
jgi:ribosomal protein L7/L12